MYTIVYKYHWVFKAFSKIWVSLLNSFLLSLHLRYHEIPRKEEIYSYITIIIRVLGNLIHKCTSIILRLFGISDSATLNRRHHWKKFITFRYYWTNCKKLKATSKDFLSLHCRLHPGNSWRFRRFNFISQ